jgi:uncharacterized membrane protein YdjX (TVP38/TMEM64 family)
MSSSNRRFHSSFKLLLGAIAIAVLIIGAKQLNLFELVQTFLQNTLLWIKDLGAFGVLAYILIYNLATVFFIPGSLLTLGGGAIYGAVWGSLYVFTAALLGATLAFLIGRYVAQGWVRQKIAGNQRFSAIANAVAENGFKIVLLTRLSPVFPFNLLNYGFGITQVSLKDYVFGSVGMLPGTIMYVYIGSLVGDLATLGNKQALTAEAQTLQWIIKIVGFMATIGVSIYVTRIAKKALNQTVLPGDATDVPSDGN